MNKSLANIAAFLFLTFCGHAQTNVIYTTNFVVQPANFRAVNGGVYNITNSPFWTNVSGRVWLVAGKIVVIEKNQVVPAGTNAPQKLALTNFEGNVVEGNLISTLAMRVGSLKTRELTMELWDCGTNTSLPVITTNEVGPLDKQAIKKERL